VHKASIDAEIQSWCCVAVIGMFFLQIS